MKNNLSAIWGVALLGCVIYFGYDFFNSSGASNQQRYNRNPVYDFYTQLVAIQKEYFPKFEAEKGHSPFSDVDLYNSYYLSLASLNASACPSDFQQVWAECLKVERICAADYTSVRGAGFIFSMVKFMNPSWYRELISHKNARDLAYIELKASAVRHGLTFNN